MKKGQALDKMTAEQYTKERNAMIQQKKLKARGSKKGFPDIVIWYTMPYYDEPLTLCLEVKAPGESARPEQKEIHKLLEEQGCPTFIVHSIAETEKALRDHGVPLKY